jgi:excisionase family DNA binding protein
MNVQLPSANEAERLFYSQKDFAQLFSVSVHTVIRDVRAGKIRTAYYGTRRLIPKSEVERIAAELAAQA